MYEIVLHKSKEKIFYSVASSRGMLTEFFENLIKLEKRIASQNQENVRFPFSCITHWEPIQWFNLHFRCQPLQFMVEMFRKLILGLLFEFMINQTQVWVIFSLRASCRIFLLLRNWVPCGFLDISMGSYDACSYFIRKSYLFLWIGGPYL